MQEANSMKVWLKVWPLVRESATSSQFMLTYFPAYPKKQDAYGLSGLSYQIKTKLQLPLIKI